MAAEPKKPRIETEDDVSSPMRNDMQKDSHEDEAKEQLEKLEWYYPEDIEFYRKSDINDATFIVEGKKIYAGRNFLSIHSQYFKALLNGDFAERNKDEIMLSDVSYWEFYNMLECLVNPPRNIDAKFAESLLTLGDRFDIKHLVDRVENFLIKTREFAVSSKLLLADRFRLIRLQTECVGSIGLGGEQTSENVEKSEEYGHLSESAKNAYYEVKRNFGFPIDARTKIVSDDCMDLMEENGEEPPEGFIAHGMIRVIYGGEESQTIDIAGLNWSIVTNDESAIHYSKYSSYLVVNKNRPSSVEWSVEGFVKEEIVRNNRENKARWRREKQYKFSFNNSNRVGRMPKIEWQPDRTDRSTSARFTIYITSVSGVRKSPSFDFSSPDYELADGVFIVEGQKIHVNKQYMSTICYTFQDEFWESNEMELKDVKYKEFIELLHVIYPSCKYITDDSAEYILDLAEKFFIEGVLDRIIDADKVSIITKLRISDDSWRYRIEDHFVKLFDNSQDFSSFKTTQDFKDLKKLPFYEKLSYDAKAGLFERMAEVAGENDL